MKDLLTIKNEISIKTMRVSEWLREDAVFFDVVRREKSLKVDKRVLDILISKLRSSHYNYYRNTLGLKAEIEFKGHNKLIQASVPYSLNPVEFYKWWCENYEKITMTLEEKIKLFDKVYLSKPAILKKEHKKLINKE